MMLGKIENDQITLMAIANIKSGEIIGFDAYGCLCPTQTPNKVKAIHDVAAGAVAEFKLIRAFA